MELKLYTHRVSQPSRALITFCKMNGLEFEEIVIDLSKRQHKSPEFKEINPMGQVPAIVHGDFKLFESHACLIYLASAFPGVADHWYPIDLQKRAKIHSVLDWHHSNLRRGSVMYILNTKLGPVFGLPLNPQAAAEGEKLLSCSLKRIESFWLSDSGPFLVGGDKPSIADLSLICEIMQLEILDEDDRHRLLEPYKKVKQWIENVKEATSPHFDEVHDTLYKFSAMLKQKSAGGKSEA
ncbi:glutathione S-transferase T1 [Ricinus communis]|uniref:glutathione transferase n=1 Tax=Ricinus communis TaxID=3988 RepID=B9RCA2_RICCO|nr:glutathione S-transferase T1 [Ricinus communis]EEF51173.1 glutathione-s-transferase theta, gst, putative [Ricinus communis]|eukprot:XP_002509786.1 glutathione S-transferase T1 [Ricinus communis]